MAKDRSPKTGYQKRSSKKKDLKISPLKIKAHVIQ